ncbi:MAG TPA: hypothetical protein DIW48_06575 [Sphaerochaeta sp.]|nr:hypothetical protein [Sphaerochaeta sp.]
MCICIRRNLMKKHVMLALLILFLGSSFVFAGALGAGVSAGGSLSFVDSTSTDTEGTPRYGFTGGVFGEFAFYSIENVVDFSAQPGVYYAMKGYNQTAPSEVEAVINYIEIPVLLKASVPLNLPVQPYILVGPALSVKLNSEWTPNALEGASELNEELTLLDYGIVMGAGVDLDMGISIDARFNLGLSQITKGSTYLETQEMKNRYVSLMVSYNIL